MDIDGHDSQDNGRRITLLGLVPSLEQQLQTSFNVAKPSQAAVMSLSPLGRVGWRPKA
jgi:hypothetical protein